jgi:uncharacterized protein YeaO (DUF488 family)
MLAVTFDGERPNEMFKLKRAYDEPEAADGARYLIDRLWPRGVTKASLKLDDWLKELAPSDSLRRWFNHDPEKWNEFRKRYFAELDTQPDGWLPLIHAARKGVVTLVYSAHDTEHNNAVALAEYLKTRA